MAVRVLLFKIINGWVVMCANDFIRGERERSVIESERLCLVDSIGEFGSMR